MPPLHHAIGKPGNYRVLYVDMNGFFASIEQQDKPELRGKPVAVMSHLHPRATVLASSYEAKAFGVTTGIKMEDAKRMAPSLICIDSTPSRYREVHIQVMKILTDICGPEVQPRSIDEAAIYLAANWQNEATAVDLARRIKAAFQEELGEYLRCSIGIAPNSTLAKLGTDLKKPDGLFIITLENLPQVMATTRLTLLAGIGERMAAQLARHEITTAKMFYDTPAEVLRTYFGIWGQYWWWRLHGFECDGNGEGLKSMSHEHVLKEWTRNKHQLELALAKMSDRLLYRLSRNHFQCRGIFVSLRLSGAPRFVKHRFFDAPTANHTFLLQAFMATVAELPPHLPYAVRKINIGFFGLFPETQGMQLDLEALEIKGTRAGIALTTIRNRFGYEAIQTASTLALGRHVAREQIGFGRIHDV